MSLISLALLLGVLALAWANGANDNFKGVATLYGSGLRDFARVRLWTTLATAAGSLLSVALAARLLEHFSGKGLVPPEVLQSPQFATAVALGAAATVLLATWAGLPISTTHALVGALVGAGIASGQGVAWGVLGMVFLVPLLFSPLVALAATGSLYPLLHWARRRLGVTSGRCICVGTEVVEVLPDCCQPSAATALVEKWSVRVDDSVQCRYRYQGRVLGVDVDRLLDSLHHLSAAAVCFSRGVNDTPKIAALLLLLPWSGSPVLWTVLVAGAMAAGGWFHARRVAETLAHRITTMNPGQGLAANLVTSAVVLGASGLGMPVSTTHVSCGTLFGVGAVTRQVRWKWIGTILLAWGATLPLAALVAGLLVRLWS